MNIYYDGKKSAELEQKLIEKWSEVERLGSKDYQMEEHSPVTHGHEKHVYDVIYAVSDDTEILTPNGWKLIGILIEGEDIFSLNLNSLKIEKDIVLKIHKGEPKERDLIHLQSRKVDQLVSFNHRVLCKSRLWKKWSEFTYHIAEEVIRWSSPIIIPCAYPQETLQEYLLGDKEILLAGWLISEGHFHKPSKQIYKDKVYSCKDERVDIGQRKSVHSEYYNEILSLLDSFGFKYRPYADKIVILATGGGKEIRKIINEKRIPREWLNGFSNRQLKILFSTMMKGDGGAKGHIYFSHDEILLSQVQELLTRIGVKSQIGRNYICYGDFGNPNTEEVSKKSIEKYNGAIYCISTNNGNFVMRRKGKVSITGNCPMKFVCRDLGFEKKFTKESIGMMFIGVVAQKLIQWLYPMDEREFESCIEDIISGHLDVFEEKKYPLEIKASRKRIFKKEQLPDSWITQIAVYMAMESRYKGWIVIVNLVMCQIYAFCVDMNKEELMDTLQELMRRADNLDCLKAEKNKEKPDYSKAEIQSEEYEYCDCKSNCPRRDDCKKLYNGIEK